MIPDWKSMGYEPRGQISDDGRSFFWYWSDLFEDDGFPSEVWSYEMFPIVAKYLQEFEQSNKKRMKIFGVVKALGQEDLTKWSRLVDSQEVDGYNIDDTDFQRMTTDIILGLLHRARRTENEFLILSFVS